MAFQSFSNFEWLNLQPAWYKPDPGRPGDAALQDEAARIVERTSMKWLGFAPYEYRRLFRLRVEVRDGKRGEG